MTFYEREPDFHSVMSIQLGELIEGGLFDWENDASMRWDSYDEQQYARVCRKFVNRYYYRDIGIIPYKQWLTAYMRRMNEIMPKYKQLYKLLDSGANVMQELDEYVKSRNVFSDFPATQLGDNQDYASNATDRQDERIVLGDFIEKSLRIANDYRDVDVLILDELEPLFSCLMTVNINGI